MEIDEFKKKHKIKKKRLSNLEKYKKEILELWNEDISLKDIQLFLIENGVKTSFQNISKFIRAETQNNTSQTLVNKTKPSTKTQTKPFIKTANQSKDKGREAVKQLGSFFGKKE